jgi:hypothetical protein
VADVNQVTITNGIPTAGSGTVDTLIVTNALLRQLIGGDEYETVAASQTDQALGTSGAQGDYLTRLILVVATAATAATSIKDGAGSAISIFPNSPGGGIGTYTIDIGLTSIAGAWSVTTGAGVSVIAVGTFT